MMPKRTWRQPSNADKWAEVGPELLNVLKRMLLAYPPCSRPVGAPGSEARLQWEDECELRNDARNIMYKASEIGK